jgi:hypothetical protein
LRSAGVEILFESAVDDSGNAWALFRAPDGNIYEFTKDPASPDRTEGQCCVASGPGHAEDATSADQMAMVSSSNAIATRRFGGFSAASS